MCLDFEDVAASQKVRESRLEEVKRRAEDEAKAVCASASKVNDHVSGQETQGRD